jgi:hypothetical protein
MFVRCKCCVLSGRGLCDEMITRPEESYRLWCVVVCDLENITNEEAMTCVGSQRHSKEMFCLVLTFRVFDFLNSLFSPDKDSSGYRRNVAAYLSV